MEEGEASRDARRTLILAWWMGFTMWGLLLAVGPLLPSIQAELGLGFTSRSLVLALPFLSVATAAIPGGYLADRRGIRGAVGVGSGVAVVGAGLRAVPGPAYILLVAAVVFGVGLGLVIPNLPKLVSTRFQQERRGLATGIYATGLIAGSLCGVYLTGLLANSIGSWRVALATWAVAGAIAVASWWIFLPRDDPVWMAPARGYGRLMHRGDLWILAFLFAAGNASYFFLVGAYPDYLVSRGVASEAAFGYLSLLIGVGIPAIFAAPILSDRVGLRRPFLWGPHIAIAALLLTLPLIPGGALVLASVGLGFAEMAIFALALLLPVDLFSSEEVGRASGIVISVAYAGALLGPVAFGVILDLTQSFSVALGTFALLSVASAAATFTLPETGPRRKALSPPQP